MKQLTMVFAILFTCISCGQEKIDLAGTKWRFFVTEDVYNYIIFTRDSTYISYDCELGVKFFGRYVVSADTVIKYQERSDFETDPTGILPDGSTHLTGKETILLLHKNGQLFFSEEVKYTKDETYVEEELEER